MSKKKDAEKEKGYEKMIGEVSDLIDKHIDKLEKRGIVIGWVAVVLHETGVRQVGRGSKDLMNILTDEEE